MANIEIEVIPVVTVFPFQGVINAPGTVQPIQRIIFSAISQAIAAKIATNTQYIQIDCICPVGYAYSLDYCHAFLSITSEVASSAEGIVNYNNNALLRVTNGWTDAQNYVPLTSAGATPNNNLTAAKIWRTEGFGQFLAFNDRTETVVYRVRISDDDAVVETKAGTLQFELAVYQYRLDQAYSVTLNSPQPVISR